MLSLNTLHNASALLLLVGFSGKVTLHYYLDYQRGSRVPFLYFLAMPGQYLGLYRTPVVPTLVPLRRFCNGLWVLAISSLLLNAAIGLVLYCRYHFLTIFTN